MQKTKSLCQQHPFKRKHPNRSNKKRCKNATNVRRAGFPNQLIAFEKIGEDPITGKIRWKLIDENGLEHKHKFVQNNNNSDYSAVAAQNENKASSIFKRKRIVDIATVTDVEQAKKLITLGWEYKTSYPATISNIPHYILVKRE